MFHDGQPEYAVHPAPLHGDRGALDNTVELTFLALLWLVRVISTVGTGRRLRQ